MLRDKMRLKIRRFFLKLELLRKYLCIYLKKNEYICK